MKHVLLVLKTLFAIIDGKYKERPGQRQHLINICSMTTKQIGHIIEEAESEEMLIHARRGFGHIAEWK